MFNTPRDDFARKLLNEAVKFKVGDKVKTLINFKSIGISKNHIGKISAIGPEFGKPGGSDLPDFRVIWRPGVSSWVRVSEIKKV